MPGTTLLRNERQEDLLKQLEKAGVSPTTSTGSLDSLKENSSIARETLEVMGEWDGAVYNFGSTLPKTTRTRGTRTGN